MIIIFYSVIIIDLSKEIDFENLSLSRSLNNVREPATQRPKERALQTESRASNKPWE
jgi:hypothetical protein